MKEKEKLIIRIKSVSNNMTSSSLCCSSSTGWIWNCFVSNQFGFHSNVNGSFRLSSQIKSLIRFLHVNTPTVCPGRPAGEGQRSNLRQPRARRILGNFEMSLRTDSRSGSGLSFRNTICPWSGVQLSVGGATVPSKWWGRRIGVIGEEKGGGDLTAARSARSARRDGGTGIIGQQSVDVQV